MFDGLGILGEPYTIELEPYAKPFALHTARRIPYPMRDKVKEELAHMEEWGVINKVDQNTTWCAGMVAVPKKSGTVRICVDLKPLNRSVCHKFHPLAMVDEILLISRCQIFF